MDSLPLELHAHILEFACTDDGTTARSLALVSRYVREVSAPYIYQSIAISGMEQMSELVGRLDVIPPHLRRIRHLFLSDWTRSQAKERVVRASEDAQDGYEAEKTLALRILALAAPMLETLAVVVSCPYTGPSILGSLFTLPLPRLVHLSVHGFYPFPNVPRSMPRLERLHLSGNRNPHGLLQLGSLDTACPALTHLHISGLVAAVSFAEEMRAAFEGQDDHATTPVFSLPSSLPPLVSEIVIETRRVHHTVPRKAALLRGLQLLHDKMLMHLHEIESRTDISRSLRLSVLEKVQDDDVYSTLRHNWLSILRVPCIN